MIENTTFNENGVSLEDGELIFMTAKSYEQFKPAAFCQAAFGLKSAKVTSDGLSHNKNNYSCDVVGVSEDGNECSYTIIVRKRRYPGTPTSFYTHGTLTVH